MAIDIKAVCNIARQAGAAIMKIYDGDFRIETKSDDSPLTCADRAAHDIIVAGLAEHFPGTPVLSEEGKDIPYAERKGWERFWLVDPLDGTKEFIKRNGEFTVNIALVEGDRAVLGVVYVPAMDKLYWGARDQGSFIAEGDADRAIGVRRPDPERGLTVVVSRSHPSPDLDDYLKTVKVAETISVGSSLKLCAVAEGRADLYPRLGPTMEWDTAAGQAIVESAGGMVTTPEGEPLRYNKEDLHNSHFLVAGR